MQHAGVSDTANVNALRRHADAQIRVLANAALDNFCQLFDGL